MERRSGSNTSQGLAKRFSNTSNTRRSESVMVRHLSHHLSAHASVPRFHTALGKQSISWQDRIADLVESVPFNIFIILVVLTDFCFFFINADNASRRDVGEDAILGVELTVAIIFVLEMVLKFYVYGVIGIFFNTWNLTDFVIMIATVVSVVLDMSTSNKKNNHDLTHSVVDFSSAVPIIRLVRVVRLFRIFHILNTIRDFSLSNSVARQSDVRLPVLICLDILNRAIELVSEPGVREYVENFISIEDLRWVVSVIQADKLYSPDIQLDETLPPDVRQLLGGGPPPPIQKSLDISVVEPVRPYGNPPETIIADLGFRDSPDLQLLMLDVGTWDFDVFRLTACTDQKPLLFVGFYVAHSLGIAARFKIPDQVLIRFLTQIESKYVNTNPYNNSTKAASMVASVAYFLDQCRVMDSISPIETFALFVASIILDVGHLGVTNSFLARTHHPLALEYNDVSPMENYHLFLAFSVLSQPDCDIFASLSAPEKSQIRDLIMNFVLSSDMRDHYILLAKLSAKLIDQTTGLDLTKDSDRILALKVLLHAADISAPAKPWRLFCEWQKRLDQEMILQGDAEKAQGLPPSMFMDRELISQTSSQSKMAFANIIAFPLFECVVEFLRVMRKGAPNSMVDMIKQAMSANKTIMVTQQTNTNQEGSLSL